jgi:hypothetical protein
VGSGVGWLQHIADQYRGRRDHRRQDGVLHLALDAPAPSPRFLAGWRSRARLSRLNSVGRREGHPLRPELIEFIPYRPILVNKKPG